MDSGFTEKNTMSRICPYCPHRLREFFKYLHLHTKTPSAYPPLENASSEESSDGDLYKSECKECEVKADTRISGELKAADQANALPKDDPQTALSSFSQASAERTSWDIIFRIGEDGPGGTEKFTSHRAIMVEITPQTDAGSLPGPFNNFEDKFKQPLGQSDSTRQILEQLKEFLELLDQQIQNIYLRGGDDRDVRRNDSPEIQQQTEKDAPENKGPVAKNHNGTHLSSRELQTGAMIELELEKPASKSMYLLFWYPVDESMWSMMERASHQKSLSKDSAENLDAQTETVGDASEKERCNDDNNASEEEPAAAESTNSPHQVLKLLDKMPPINFKPKRDKWRGSTNHQTQYFSSQTRSTKEVLGDAKAGLLRQLSSLSLSREPAAVLEALDSESCDMISIPKFAAFQIPEIVFQENASKSGAICRTQRDPVIVAVTSWFVEQMESNLMEGGLYCIGDVDRGGD